MWKIIGNIFKGIDVNEIANKADDWKLTEEERVRYHLEYLKSIPTGFQLAQRLIGILFSIAFLGMVVGTFVMMAFNMNVDGYMEFIGDTIGTPIAIILATFFGGGTLNSLKKK